MISNATGASNKCEEVAQIPHASFELRFKGEEKFQLTETRFQFAQNDSFAPLQLTNNQKLGFQWTPAVKGLSMCFIGYAIHSIDQKPSEFKFSAPALVKSKISITRKSKEKSAVASLGQALGKKTIWVEHMFKSQTVELNQVIKKVFGGHNREGKNKDLDVTVTINHRRLPPNRVKIFLNGTHLTAATGLKNLLQNILSQCPASNPFVLSPAAQSVKKSATDAFGLLPSISVDNRTEPTEPLSSMQPRGNKSLADWFHELSSNEILKYIKAIISAPKHKMAALYEDLRDPQCINVMAEKLVNGPIDNMLRLFWENSQNSHLEKLLCAVCVAIDTDPARRAKHFETIAQSEFADMELWLTAVAKYFPMDVIAVHNVESDFIRFAESPRFDTIHNKDGLETYSYAIEGFFRFDCGRAIKILLNKCFEDVCRRIKEAQKENPQIVKNFVKLIGKNEFRSRVEKTLNRKQLTTFQRQMNAIAAAGE